MMRGDYASALEAGRRAVELNPLFSSAYKGYLAALGLQPTQQSIGGPMGFSGMMQPLTEMEQVSQPPFAIVAGQHAGTDAFG